jgi:hypothetical protein
VTQKCIISYKGVSLTTGGTVLTVPYVLLFVITASLSSAALACSAANSGVTIPLRSVEQQKLIIIFLLEHTGIQCKRVSLWNPHA